MVRLFLTMCSLVLMGVVWAEEPKAEGLPRYKLTPGQELIYHSDSVFKFGKGQQAGEHRSDDDWTIWVLRNNPDGSTRLLCRSVSIFKQFHNGKVQGDHTPQMELVYADMFADGRIVPNQSIQYRGSPKKLFPPLPKKLEEWTTGWESVSGDEKTVAKPLPGGFSTERSDLFAKIYLSTQTQLYTFDASQGLITKSDGEHSQGYGFDGKGTSKLELKSQKTLSPAELKQLNLDADRYFEVSRKYEENYKAASKLDPDKCKAQMANALENLKTVADGVKQTDMQSALSEMVKKHDRMADYVLDAATRRAKYIGKPVFAFKAKDMKDKPVAFDDYQGRVVVLDFWYRGCGWCVKAMPQMNELTTDFLDKPVAILGMNTDAEIKDAEFVIQEMKLKYPTLRIEHEMASKFGVQGFPTLLIIDKKGIVREMHVGYSATLREEVGKIIRDLLAE